jgi:hypothetical protein
MSRSDVHDPMNDRPDDALDVAIDRALREITAVDPPQRMTSTVMARIEGRNPRRERMRRSWPLAATLAAAALVALAVGVSIVSRGRVERATPQTAAPQTARPGAGAPLAPHTTAPMIASATGTADAAERTSASAHVPAVSARAHDRAVAAAASGLEPAIAIGPIAAPAPIAIDDIAPEAAVLAPLGIQEIEIEPIEVDEVVKR